MLNIQVQNHLSGTAVSSDVILLAGCYITGNLKAVCVELLDELTAAYNGMLNVDVILLTGGTGTAWEKYIREYYKDTKALEIILAGDGKDAFRANVKGYYNMLVSRCR